GNFQIFKNNIHAKRYQAVAEQQAEPCSNRDPRLCEPFFRCCGFDQCIQTSLEPAEIQPRQHGANRQPFRPRGVAKEGDEDRRSSAKHQRQPGDPLFRPGENRRRGRFDLARRRLVSPFHRHQPGRRRRISRNPAKNPSPPKINMKMNLVCNQWSIKYPKPPPITTVATKMIGSSIAMANCALAPVPFWPEEDPESVLLGLLSKIIAQRRSAPGAGMVQDTTLPRAIQTRQSSAQRSVRCLSSTLLLRRAQRRPLVFSRHTLRRVRSSKR